MKLFKSIKENIKTLKANISTKIEKFTQKATSLVWQAHCALNNCTGEGFVDSGVKILIAVVIGALLLGGLYLLFDETILPTLTTKIKALFNYVG